MSLLIRILGWEFEISLIHMDHNNFGELLVHWWALEIWRWS
jgi:hypothetical protein